MSPKKITIDPESSATPLHSDNTRRVDIPKMGRPLGSPKVESMEGHSARLSDAPKADHGLERINGGNASNSPTSMTTRNPFVIIRHHPYIIFVACLIFAVLCTAGIAITIVFAQNETGASRDDAFHFATETLRSFGDQLDRAILPLFSIAQFVDEISLFHNLPDLIGPREVEGSLPFLPPAGARQSQTKRNVTGVCDDNVLVDRFNEIAATIKRHSRLDGILVNIQLAPESVVCLIYPVNNTEDFTNGNYVDTSNEIGHDLLADPQTRPVAQESLRSQDLYVTGPMSLYRCASCSQVVVEKAFVARLPIERLDAPNDTETIPGDKWGIALAYIDWDKLAEQLDVQETLAERGYEYQLIRTATNTSGDSFENGDNESVVLSESVGFVPDQEHIVRAMSSTANGQWEISVSYTVDTSPPWRAWALSASVLIAFCISALVSMILIQKHFHTMALAEKSAVLVANAKQSARAERELNDFIAHEVRNPLSAALSACNFVASALSESQPLLDAESRRAAREDVNIIESSLQFVNDLLRNMLDMHRASSKQLSLENSLTDLFEDILSPVAAMLYRRDHMYEVYVECPPDLVVMTDRLRLKQVVLNLGKNAAKFVERGFIRLRSDVVDGSVRIYVEDSGPGIPEEKRNQLFRKFQESLDSLNQGTGIGLSLCQSLVELMGGRIWLDEQYNSDFESFPGTRFVVDLNMPPSSIDAVTLDKEASTARTSSSSGEGHSDGETYRIEKNPLTPSCMGDPADPSTLPNDLSVLFVDDDLILRKLFLRSVKKVRPDWKLKEASNGETALRLVDTEKFDVIFLDQYMTSVDKQLLGTETVRALRAKGVESTICGLSANDLELPFLRAGADCFVIKPFPCKDAELIFELRRVLGSRRSQRLPDDEV